MKYLYRTIPFFIVGIAVALLHITPQGAKAAERGKIVFVSAESGGWELWMADVRNNALQQLTDTAPDERSPCWSPDGSKIVYATTQGELQIIDVQSKDVEVLQVPSVRNAEPAWSPDGSSLVYVSYTQPRKLKNELWVMSVEENAIRARRLPVPEGLKTFPRWSPDGKVVMYSRLVKMEPSGPIEDICRFDLTTQQEEILVSNGFDNMQAIWSPDGKYLAYASNQSGNFDIWLWRSDKTRHRQLTLNPAMDTTPTWSPDGRELAFVSARTGIQQIWIVDVVTGLERQLTVSNRGSRDPEWGKSE